MTLQTLMFSSASNVHHRSLLLSIIVQKSRTQFPSWCRIMRSSRSASSRGLFCCWTFQIYWIKVKKFHKKVHVKGSSRIDRNYTQFALFRITLFVTNFNNDSFQRVLRILKVLPFSTPRRAAKYEFNLMTEIRLDFKIKVCIYVNAFLQTNLNINCNGKKGLWSCFQSTVPAPIEHRRSIEILRL